MLKKSKGDIILTGTVSLMVNVETVIKIHPVYKISSGRIYVLSCMCLCLDLQ